MADFEELKLTVNLVDNASAGLANIRTQITQLTQTASQAQTAFAGVATGTQQLGNAAQQAAPKVSSQEKALKELSRSAEETGRGLVQMALAARRGGEAWAEMALSTREAFTGLKGATAAMGELGVASRAMVLGLGSVAIGVAAVGAAVAAYGISVFKFSQEMYTLSQTAKALGTTFGQLRSMTEQNERFGISAEQTTEQLANMNEVVTDLTLSGSRLRQQMLSQGVSPKAIDDFTKLTDKVDRYNKAREYEQQAHDDWLKRTHGDEAIASTMAARAGRMFGETTGTAYLRDPMEHQTKDEVERDERIAKLSAEIAKQWREIQKTISDIKTEFMGWGLPLVLGTLKLINTAFEVISGTIKKINEGLATFGTSLLGIAKHLPIIGPAITLLDELRKLGGGGQGSGATATPGAAPPAAGRPAAGGAKEGLWDRFSRWRNSQPDIANDNANPLLHRASFGGDDSGGGGGGGRAQAIIKGGVYEALIEFYGFLRGGGTGGGGGAGGVMKASFGGSTGAAAGGGFAGDSFRRAGGSVSGDGGPNGSDVGPGTGRGAHGGRHGGGGGDGGPGSEGSTTPPSGNLAAQRAGFMKELDADPHLKAFAVDAMQHEGGVQSNLEQLFNYAAMRHMTIRQALHSGQYGPVNRGLISGNRGISGKQAEALRRVGAGSNITDYATDQGMAGDPNFAKYMANREHYGMHKVEGAWFSAHGEPGVRWAQQQRAADTAAAKSNSDTNKSVAASAAVPMPMNERYSTRALGGGDGTGGADTQGNAPPKRIRIQTSGGGPTSLYDTQTGDWIPGSGDSTTEMFPGSNPNWGKDFRRSGNIEDRRDEGKPGILGWAKAGAQYTAGALEAEYGMGWGNYAGPRTPLGVDLGTDRLDRAKLGGEPLDRNALNDNNKIHSTGKLDVSVNAPPGTKVNYHGQNLLKNTSMQRQTQMMPTAVGPSVDDTAQSYMRGGT